MMEKSKEQMYAEMEQLWETFSTEHGKTTKASAARARKAIGEIKKMVTDYRKASVAADKA